MTIYCTSEDCHGQAILTLHLSVRQVILFPYFDHCEMVSRIRNERSSCPRVDTGNWAQTGRKLVAIDRAQFGKMSCGHGLSVTSALILCVTCLYGILVNYVFEHIYTTSKCY